MKSIFTEKQIAEIQNSAMKIQELNNLLTSLLGETESHGIEVKTEKADATLKGVLSYLRNELEKQMSISSDYRLTMDKYSAERDRICKDFDDDFATKPETIEALAKLDEEFYLENAAKENQQPSEPVRFNSL